MVRIVIINHPFHSAYANASVYNHCNSTLAETAASGLPIVNLLPASSIKGANHYSRLPGKAFYTYTIGTAILNHF